MSYFSETLNFIRNQRNLKIITISQISGIDLTMLYHWNSGNRVPASVELVYQLADSLKLSTKERSSLVTAYMKTVFGKHTYEGFQSIFHLQQYAYREYNNTEYFPSELAAPPLIEQAFFKRLYSNTETSQALLHLISTASEEDTICYKLYPPYDELISFLGNHSVLLKDKNIEIILVYPKKNAYRYQISSYVYKKIFELFIQNHNLKVYLSEESFNEFEIHTNHVITNHSMIQTNHNLQDGIYTTYAEWIQMKQHEYDFIKSHSEFLGYYTKDFFKSDEDRLIFKDQHVYQMAFQAFLSTFLTKEMIIKHLPEDMLTEESADFKNLFLYYHNDHQAAESIHMVCSEHGIQEFMESGTLSTFPYSILTPFSMQERINLLKKAIGSISNDRYHYHMLKSENKHFFSMMKFVVVSEKELDQKSNPDSNQGISSFVLIQFLLKDNVTKELIIKNPLFTCYFEDFFKVLLHTHYCYTKKETLLKLKNILHEYNK